MQKWIGIVWIRTMPIFVSLIYFSFSGQHIQDGCIAPKGTSLILHGGSHRPRCIYWKRGEEKEASRKREWEEEVVCSLASRLHCRWDSPVVSVSMAQLTREADAHSHTLTRALWKCVHCVCTCINLMCGTAYAEIIWKNIARIKLAICRPMSSSVILAVKWKAK